MIVSNNVFSPRGAASPGQALPEAPPSPARPRAELV